MKIAVLGGGPVGVELTLQLVSAKRHTPHQIDVYEAGSGAGGGILQNWPNVNLFSPWSMNVSSLGLSETNDGLTEEAIASIRSNFDKFPTGKEYVEQYIAPLAQVCIKKGGASKDGENKVRFHYNTTVIGVGKSGGVGKKKMGSEVRSGAKFFIKKRKNDEPNAGALVAPLSPGARRGKGGSERYVTGYDVVIDCSGNSSRNSYFGRGGFAAIGEIELADRFIPSSLASPVPREGRKGWQKDDKFTRNIPSDFSVYKNKTVAVIGSGYSAATTVKGLITTAKRLIWITRKGNGPGGNKDEEKPLYDLIENDALPNRSALSTMANSIAKEKADKVPRGQDIDGFCLVTYLSHKEIESVTCSSDDAAIGIHFFDPDYEAAAHDDLPSSSLNDDDYIVVDCLISNVGLRPDLELTKELQVQTCYASEGPMKLAATLKAGDSSGDCLAQVAPGIEALKTTEPNFFVLGIKSYGRNSSFLLRIGIEQAESVAKLINEL